MKKILFFSLLLLAFNVYAADDCDLFKEEVAVISEQVQDIYKEMYEATDFVKTAKERKTESDNQKLGRYLASIKKELELIEHGMSQLKLHQDCACEGFKFQYIDNTLVEVKYWLKKAQSVERVKPKKTNYDAIESNLKKSMDKATNLQVYFLKPCGSNAIVEAESNPVPSVEEAVIPVDTSSQIAENIEPPKEEIKEVEDTSAVLPVMDTVKHSDTSLKTEVESEAIDKEIKEEETVESASSESENAEVNTNSENTNSSDGSNAEDGSGTGSAAGAVVAGAAAATGVAATVISSNDKDTIAETELEPVALETANIQDTTESIEDIFADEEEVVAPTVMDTVKHTDASVKTEAESNAIDEEIASTNKESASVPESTTPPKSANVVGASTESGAARVAGAAVVAAGAAVVASNDKDSTKTAKENPKDLNAAAVAIDTVKQNANSQVPDKTMEVVGESVETTPVAPPVMDTVKHSDVSFAAVEEEEKEEALVETPKEPKVKAAVVAPVVKPAPKTEESAAPVANDFHYAVQIATGNVNTSDSKYTSLSEKVYSVNESGMTKIRIGKYKTFNEAKASKNKAFTAGFIDAFVVVYNNGERISFAEARSIENGGFGSVSNKKTEKAAVAAATEKIKTPKLKKKDDVFLAVQIGAILSSTDPVYELIKYERMVGMEVHVLHGEPMRFYTGKAITAAAADVILNKVRAAGVKEAFLIGVSNDQRIDYNAALKHLGL